MNKPIEVQTRGVYRTYTDTWTVTQIMANLVFVTRSDGLTTHFRMADFTRWVTARVSWDALKGP